MTDYRWTYHIYYGTHIQTNDRLQMDMPYILQETYTDK